MTQFLPPNLLALFAPREPIPYFPPLDQLPWEKKPWPYTGVSQYLNLFEDPSETPAPTRAETKEERMTRKQKEREERHREQLKDLLEAWDPSSDPKVQGDPFKTIFVGRINFDTSESKLRRELEVYGPIKRITMVQNKGKPRGYAFVEYEKERDMHGAYKYADGKKIDGRRIVVDVERGRTVKSWKPRRLGGGLGGTRRGAPHENIKYSGRVDERDIGGGNNEERDEREREERDRDRDRDRDRERERDRRSRERDRDRKRRSRSHERVDRERKKRSRSREKDKGKKDRSRSRERDRKDRERKDKEHRRESERDRDHPDRKSSRRDRDRDKDKNRRDRDHDRKRGRGDEDNGGGEKKMKMEPPEAEGEGQVLESNGQEA